LGNLGLVILIKSLKPMNNKEPKRYDTVNQKQPRTNSIFFNLIQLNKLIIFLLILGNLGLIILIKSVKPMNNDISQEDRPITQYQQSVKAMTWTTLQLIKSWNNQNYYALVGSDINTNPYEGDTLITESLPILCIKKANLPKPDFVSPHFTPGGAMRGTWSNGYIALTKPIQGLEITSLKVANEICQQTFGEGYRMAEFHDGAAWDFWGEIVNNANFTLQDRFWVFINDQQANPWSRIN
jgi:hypothetical protein